MGGAVEIMDQVAWLRSGWQDEVSAEGHTMAAAVRPVIGHAGLVWAVSAAAEHVHLVWVGWGRVGMWMWMPVPRRLRNLVPAQSTRSSGFRMLRLELPSALPRRARSPNHAYPPALTSVSAHNLRWMRS